MQHNGHTAASAPLRRKHLAELLGRLGSEAGTLMQQELALARAEMAEKLEQAKAELAEQGKKAGAGAGMFGAATVAALLALGAVTAALVLLLDRWLATDLAALIVALAWALVAAAAALRGRDKVREVGGINAADYVPRETIETVKEDVEWAKTPRSSAGR
jgi:hypothetical protein